MRLPLPLIDIEDYSDIRFRNKVISLCDDKISFKFLVDHYDCFIDKIIHGSETIKTKYEKFINVYKIVNKEQVLMNSDIIFKYSESKIELLFLNLINFLCYNQLPLPSLLTFTDPVLIDDNKKMELSMGNEEYTKRTELIYEAFGEIDKSFKKKDLSELIENPLFLNDIESPLRETIILRLIALFYETWFARTFVSIQSPLNNFKVKTKFIRPDIYIWNALYVENIIVECDGFKYHKGKDSFINDRIRDRELLKKNFKVMRFSGSEIYKYPFECAIELINYVIECKNNDILGSEDFKSLNQTNEK